MLVGIFYPFMLQSPGLTIWRWHRRLSWTNCWRHLLMRWMKVVGKWKKFFIRCFKLFDNQVLNVVQMGEAGKIKCVYILICTAIFLVDQSGTSLVILWAAGVCYASEISRRPHLYFILWQILITGNTVILWVDLTARSYGFFGCYFDYHEAIDLSRLRFHMIRGMKRERKTLYFVVRSTRLNFFTSFCYEISFFETWYIKISFLKTDIQLNLVK